MKKKKIDWLNRPFPILALMFDNVASKIDNYKVSYQLTDEWIARLKLICETFTTAFAGITQNRATDQQQSDWFKLLWESDPENGHPSGSPASQAPIFKTITLPAGAFIGLKEEFREMIRFFKANSAYTEADGEDLMIVTDEGEEVNLTEASPALTNSLDVDGYVVSKYRKGEFSGIEEQWREAGETHWQLADKTELPFVRFKPTLTNPDQPTRIELRAVYIVKNKRVGQWSPVYTMTIG